MTLRQRLETAVRAELSELGRVLQDDLIEQFDCTFQDWALAHAPELLIEQTGAVDERYARANDARRKELAA